MSSLIQVSDSNAIIYISTSPFFAKLTTIRDSSGKRSSSNTITISTTGLTFSDGSSTKTIDTPYASITLDSSAHLVHGFPFRYAGSADAQGLTVHDAFTISGRSDIHDSLILSNTISSFGYIDAQSITVGADPILTETLLVNAVKSLGQTYLSSILIQVQTLSNYVYNTELYSTVAGLGTTYVSSLSLQSTVAGLGTYGFVSTAGLVSTTQGLSNIYETRLTMTSTFDGLGNYYVSTSSFLSSFATFNGGYIQAPTYTSTVAGLGSANYISTAQVTSTIQRLGSLGYISTSWLVSTVAALSGLAQGDATAVYTSTTAGLGQTYLSTAGLVSSVTGVSNANTAILDSTIKGLGTAGYISTSQLVSTVNGLGQVYISSPSLVSTVGGFFTSTYTPSFISTVNGLGQIYISSAGLQSTVGSILTNTSVQLVSTTAGLGQTYISKDGLFSTVQGFSNIYITSANLVSSVTNTPATINAQNLVSTVNNFGSTYISSPQLTTILPTVTASNTAFFAQQIPNLGSPPYLYVSTPSLVSTVNNLGQVYISTASLFSTVNAFLNETSYTDAELTSSVRHLGTKGYVSTASLTSTVTGVRSTGLTSDLFITNYNSNLFPSYIWTANYRVGYLPIGCMFVKDSNTFFWALHELFDYITQPLYSNGVIVPLYSNGSPTDLGYTPLFTFSSNGLLYVMSGNTPSDNTNIGRVKVYSNLSYHTSYSTGISSTTEQFILDRTETYIYIVAYYGPTRFGSLRLSDGQFTALNTTVPLQGASGIAVDPTNTYLYICDIGGIHRYHIASGTSTIIASVNLPYEVAVDSNYLYYFFAGTLTSLSLYDGQYTVRQLSDVLYPGYDQFRLGNPLRIAAPIGPVVVNDILYSANSFPNGPINKISLSVRYDLFPTLITIGLSNTYIKMPALVSSVTGLGSFGYVSSLTQAFLTSVPSSSGIITTGRNAAVWDVAAGPFGKIYTLSSSGDIYIDATYLTNISIGANGGSLAYNPVSGVLYIAVLDANLIYSMTSTTATVFAGTGAYSSIDGSRLSATFRNPIAMCIDTTNTFLYIFENIAACSSFRTINLLTSMVSTQSITTAIAYPKGVRCDATHLYVASLNESRIVKVAISTGTATSITSPASYGLSFDLTNQYLYISCVDTLRRMDLSTSSILTVAGSSGNAGFIDGVGSNARFVYLLGITTDINGSVWMADFGNSYLRKSSFFLESNALQVYISTQSNVLQTYMNTLGSVYISTPALTSTTTSILNCNFLPLSSNQLVSTTAGIQTLLGTPTTQASSNIPMSIPGQPPYVPWLYYGTYALGAVVYDGESGAYWSNIVAVPYLQKGSWDIYTKTDYVVNDVVLFNSYYACISNTSSYVTGIGVAPPSAFWVQAQFLSNWSDGYSYSVEDVVAYQYNLSTGNKAYYYCITPTNSVLPTNTSYWTQITYLVPNPPVYYGYGVSPNSTPTYPMGGKDGVAHNFAGYSVGNIVYYPVPFFRVYPTSADGGSAIIYTSSTYVGYYILSQPEPPMVNFPGGMYYDYNGVTGSETFSPPAFGTYWTKLADDDPRILQGYIPYIAWNPSYVYPVDGYVSYLGNTYRCIRQISTAPPSNTDYWSNTPPNGSIPTSPFASSWTRVSFSNSLYIYTSNAIVTTASIYTTTTGIVTGNIYSTCNMTAAEFRASNFYADGTQLTSSSDSRLKFDITPLSNALEKIQALTGVSYVKKDCPDRKLGFIAQDVEDVYPELVFTGEDSMKSIKYDSINVILLEAIKELNSECDSLLRNLECFQ
jgi:hypothetical protein